MVRWQEVKDRRAGHPANCSRCWGLFGQRGDSQRYWSKLFMTGHNRYTGMSNEFNPITDPYQPVIYQIKIEGHLGSQWTDWFGGLAITLEEEGVTLLTGPVVDQAALYGLLKRIRDLGMPLISVNRVEPGRADAFTSIDIVEQP